MRFSVLSSSSTPRISASFSGAMARSKLCRASMVSPSFVGLDRMGAQTNRVVSAFCLANFCSMASVVQNVLVACSTTKWASSTSSPAPSALTTALARRPAHSFTSAARLVASQCDEQRYSSASTRGTIGPPSIAWITRPFTRCIPNL